MSTRQLSFLFGLGFFPTLIVASMGVEDLIDLLASPLRRVESASRSVGPPAKAEVGAAKLGLDRCLEITQSPLPVTWSLFLDATGKFFHAIHHRINFLDEFLGLLEQCAPTPGSSARRAASVFAFEIGVVLATPLAHLSSSQARWPVTSPGSFQPSREYSASCARSAVLRSPLREARVVGWFAVRRSFAIVVQKVMVLFSFYPRLNYSTTRPRPRSAFARDRFENAVTDPVYSS